MTIKESIRKSLVDLDLNGILVSSKKWQAIDSPGYLLEVDNRFLSMYIPEDKDSLAEQCKADLPWAENHFQERINPNCNHNPGYQYKNWPYYHASEHDKKFRNEADIYFSHTYMERFWPDKNIKGTGKMGYNFGDFNDLIERLKNDPGTRQGFYAIWHPQDSNNLGVRLPCTIGYFFLIREGVMNITYLIRSCDIFRHFKNDIYMTARLAQYVRDKLDKDIKMGKMHMWIGSLHCWHIEKPILKSWQDKYL